MVLIPETTREGESQLLVLDFGRLELCNRKKEEKEEEGEVEDGKEEEVRSPLVEEEGGGKTKKKEKEGGKEEEEEEEEDAWTLNLNHLQVLMCRLGAIYLERRETEQDLHSVIEPLSLSLAICTRVNQTTGSITQVRSYTHPAAHPPT